MVQHPVVIDIHIKKNLDINGRVEVELFDDKLALAGRRGPVNPVEAVAGPVLAQAGNIRRGMRSGPVGRVAAGQDAGKGFKPVDFKGRRIDGYKVLDRQIFFEPEEAKRITGRDSDGTK